MFVCYVYQRLSDQRLSTFSTLVFVKCIFPCVRVLICILSCIVPGYWVIEYPHPLYTNSLSSAHSSPYPEVTSWACVCCYSFSVRETYLVLYSFSSTCINDLNEFEPVYEILRNCPFSLSQNLTKPSSLYNNSVLPSLYSSACIFAFSSLSSFCCLNEINPSLLIFHP